jgi:hypothetical protein
MARLAVSYLQVLLLKMICFLVVLLAEAAQIVEHAKLANFVIGVIVEVVAVYVAITRLIQVMEKKRA